MRALSRLLLFVVLPVALAQPLLTVPPAPSVSSPLRFGDKLPAFEAKDTQGRTWRPADLHDKFTVVYFWSTSWARVSDSIPEYAHGSIPDILDLPEIQRFYDQVKSSKTIQVLTFCKDYDSGDSVHAQDYMKQKNYTFPVITDWVLLDKLFFERDGAKQCVINPEGRLSYPSRSRSLGSVLFEVEKSAEPSHR